MNLKGISKLNFESVDAGRGLKSALLAGAKTRWFQFRLRSILVFLFLVGLCLVLYQWIDKPRQTVNRLYELVGSSQFEEADRMLVYDDGFMISPSDRAHRVRVVRSVLLNYSQPERRNFSDLISARRKHHVPGNTACFVDTGDIKAHWLIDSVTVHNGKIRIHWRGPSDQNVRLENGKWIRNNPGFWNSGTPQ